MINATLLYTHFGQVVPYNLNMDFRMAAACWNQTKGLAAPSAIMRAQMESRANKSWVLPV
jgi:hypothetical protein